VGLLAVKLLLAPSFVVGASLAARRFGPLVGGLLAGLPVVAGPILLVYGLVHGSSFAAHAAAGTLLGLISLTAFVVVYGALCRHVRWPACVLAGWLAFVGSTVIFYLLGLPAGVALLLACGAFLVGLALLPRPRGGLQAAAPPPRWDLPLRAGCALALVLALTGAAGWLGPQLSGLLAPFPIIASVLATFTHAQRGAEEALRLLRGLLTGFLAFGLFCFTLAVTLAALGVAGGFALATAVACATQALMLTRALRARALPAPAGSEP
jgi:hypothetical protein